MSLRWALTVCGRVEASSEKRAYPSMLILKVQKVTLPSQTSESGKRLLFMQQSRAEEITVHQVQ